MQSSEISAHSHACSPSTADGVFGVEAILTPVNRTSYTISVIGQEMISIRRPEFVVLQLLL